MVHRLLGLPNEVLLTIIDHIPNADLDSFTSTCKLVRNVAAHALYQHEQRKRRYRHITYGDPDVTGDNATWVHPTLMLCGLLQHDLMCYPIELHINDRAVEAVTWDDGRDIYDGYAEYLHDKGCEPRYSDVDKALERFNKDVEKLVRACPYLQDDTVDLAQAILNEGEIGATLGFLLTLLQNLKILHVTDYDLENSRKTLWSMKTIMDNLLNVSRASSRSSTYFQPLGQLREIIFSCTDNSEDAETYSLAKYAPFFYLPSMRTIQLFDIRAESDTWDYPESHSNIENLSIYRSGGDKQSVRNYLKHTSHLRSFEYTCNSRLGILPLGDRFQYMIDKLLKYACASLHHLHIADVFFDINFYGDPYFLTQLKDFQVLKSIDIRVERLWGTKKELRDPQSNSPNVSLMEILPSSVEQAVFGDCLHRVKALASLQELSKKDKAQLPHLKSVRFDFEPLPSSSKSLEWVQGTLQAFDGRGKAITTDVNQWD
ncbi:MAG: hypothetical protein Q9195_003355 [Heterodermia aff. obscurata]